MNFLPKTLQNLDILQNLRLNKLLKTVLLLMTNTHIYKLVKKQKMVMN